MRFPHQHTVQTTTLKLAGLECRATERRIEMDVLETLTDYGLIDELSVVNSLCVRRHLFSANDCVHLPGRLLRRDVAQNQNDGPVRCNALFANAPHSTPKNSFNNLST